ncbi:peptidase S1 domain-containing protein [Haematococcus lacustris]|uniref:Serine protease n=1 Tax=Haematococcus lacustris TaxID=44745 RepID=A0A6A0ACJ8_HAELA|nr:peptidase S1 domain-containing protein [Haematococcus lacustris]
MHRPVARRKLGVFGVDRRINSPKFPTYPYTAVGQLLVRDNDNRYECSGALIAPDKVLTAAHCLYNRRAQTFYTVVGFSAGRYRSNTTGEVRDPFGMQTWAHIDIVDGYVNSKFEDPNPMDLAVVSLQDPVGYAAGWMGLFKPCQPTFQQSYTAFTAGYPVDKPQGHGVTTNCTTTQIDCNAGYQYHSCDAVEGQSGSAMWMLQKDPVTQLYLPYVRAVHNVEWRAADGITVIANSAVAITPSHYQLLANWTSNSSGAKAQPPAGARNIQTSYIFGEPYRGWGLGREKLRDLVVAGF